MKKIIFIVCILSIASFAYAGNFPHKHKLKSPKKLSDITDIQSTECDLCGCYMGLDPNFHMNLVGLRFHTFKFVTEAHTTASDPQTDHEGHPGVASTEYYNNVELFGRYYFTPVLRVLFSIPFSFNEIDGKRLNGTGDAKVIAQYQIYNSEITGKTNFWQRIFLGGGLKLPTGVYNKSLTFGVVEPHFQPGTGSLDGIFSGTHLFKFMKQNFGMNTDIVYTLNGENENDYRFANRFNVTSTIFYEVPTSTFTFLPHAGVYYEYAANDKLKGIVVGDSGGKTLFGTGGLDIYYNKFSLDLNFQFPISERLNGVQSENRFRIYTGLGYSF